MSLVYPSGYDYDGAPVLVEPEIRRLDGVVREVAVPPMVPPPTHGSLADLPFENAAAAPAHLVLSRQDEDGNWRDVTAAEFAEQVQAVAKGLIAEGLSPGTGSRSWRGRRTSGHSSTSPRGRPDW